ncbi:Hypothetical predicted protein [Podarcis lilfordi]|uniref:Uncharacterized protein n=1 Tax=Podarcis lilfordi TaxID=74358 RepID=A0AA35JPT0_9SAUR|nr:Hypothetical predicted protein [Podarcis lilfordi]
MRNNLRGLRFPAFPGAGGGDRLRRRRLQKGGFVLGCALVCLSGSFLGGGCCCCCSAVLRFVGAALAAAVERRRRGSRSSGPLRRRSHAASLRRDRSEWKLCNMQQLRARLAARTSRRKGLRRGGGEGSRRA